jgi:hypothetical protein
LFPSEAPKHGNTLWPAPGFPDSAKLSDIPHKLDEPSLSQMHRDHDGGHLDLKIGQQPK